MIRYPFEEHTLANPQRSSLSDQISSPTNLDKNSPDPAATPLNVKDSIGLSKTEPEISRKSKPKPKVHHRKLAKKDLKSVL